MFVRERENTVEVEQEMKKAYLQYSMSVIVGRALPDARDGLKPVHRRVLYAQHEMNNAYNKPYKKSARLVGDVIGKYHPHGDVAVYDAIVRMAQSFSLRYPLVDGQGNFGSIDGDSPAAMRYTEVRMTAVAEELLKDIDKKTVEFNANYDGSFKIPQVLPAKIPNLLINGSSGIAVGMATNVPPHNLGEIIDGIILTIENPDTSITTLMNTIKGPDFPSSGVIVGNAGLIKAYKTGRGSIVLRGVSHVEKNKLKDSIVITEIPYQVNKTRFIERAVECIKEKRLEGISDIRDESSRKGMRVVFDLKKGESPDVILNRLYKFTQLQISFGINLLALDKGIQPRLFSLKDLLTSFIDHRKEVITKRSIFDLNKSKARVHILLGLDKALKEIEKIVDTIKSSEGTKQAKLNLISGFEFSSEQAQAILDMKLSRLTNLERGKIASEIEALQELIKKLEKILSDETEIYKVIKNDLGEIKQKYSDERRTKILDTHEELEDEDLIEKEDVLVTFTKNGYIKRVSLDVYKSQHRGGRGIRGAGLIEGDYVKKLFKANTLTTLLVFTNTGRAIPLKVYKLPEVSRDSKGRAIVNLIGSSSEEKVVTILPLENLKKEGTLVFVTKKGILKRTNLSNFSKLRKSGVKAITIRAEDSLIDVQIGGGDSHILVATKKGQTIKFRGKDIRKMGRSAAGVIGIRASSNNEVVGISVLDSSESIDIVTITENGFGKRTSSEEFRLQKRGGSGIIGHKVNSKTGDVIGIEAARSVDDVVIISNTGQVLRSGLEEISKYKRSSQGVRVMNLRKDEYVSSFEVVSKDEDQISASH